LIDLLIATPVLSASQAATALRITSHSARAMLSALEKRGLIHEVTGRASFRFYTPTPFMHLR
jgi:predicted ArsR family transcriptional regulator